MEKRSIDFVPGSVEWADFDPTATACAMALLDLSDLLPSEALAKLFDRYLDGLRRRWAGEVDWNNYGAYEIRIVGAMVGSGGARQPASMLARFLEERRPPAWNQWPEITWRNPRSPGHLGDLPHSWIGAEFILSALGLFAYERSRDASLVLAAGVPHEWLSGDGVAIRNLPVPHGELSFSLRRREADALAFALDASFPLPAGGVIFRPPLTGRIIQVDGAGDGVRFTDGSTSTEHVWR
ncbi:MAG: hypothetical protein U1E76_11895 [Planctomycetota bacterium]